MPRGKKGNEKPVSEKDTARRLPEVKPGEVKQVISQSKLVNLMKAKRGAKKDAGEINGRVGQMIADAVENNHLHRKAFGWITQLDQMEPEKIADLLDSFEYYLDIGGINKRRESVMRMNLGAEAKDEPEAEPEPSNITKFPPAQGNA